MAQNVYFIALAKSINDDDIDTTSMLTANTDEEIPKEVLATHVGSQDMESIIRLCWDVDDIQLMSTHENRSLNLAVCLYTFNLEFIIHRACVEVRKVAEMFSTNSP